MISRYRIWIILVVCLLACAVFLTFNVTKKRSINVKIEGGIITVLAPVQQIFSTAWGWVLGVFNKYLFLVHTYEENVKLREERDALKWQINQYREMALENDRFRKLLDFANSNALSFLVADVICWDSSNWTSSLFINRGTKDGVSKDMAVVTHQGIVGQVIRTTLWVAEVQILLSPESGVSAFVQRTRSRGIVTGGVGRNRGLMKYIDTTESPRAEDIVISSGYDRIFPKGLPIGKISKTERQAHQLLQSVVIETAVDFSRLEEVLVLLDQKPVPPDEETETPAVRPPEPQAPEASISVTDEEALDAENPHMDVPVDDQ